MKPKCPFCHHSLRYKFYLYFILYRCTSSECKFPLPDSRYCLSYERNGSLVVKIILISIKNITYQLCQNYQDNIFSLCEISSSEDKFIMQINNIIEIDETDITNSCSKIIERLLHLNIFS